MRFLIKVSFPTETGNAAVKAGHISEKIESILSELKPESTYFLLENRRRTALIFVHAQSSSEIPAITDPWMLSFNANVEVLPVMNSLDFGKAVPRIEQAGTKFSNY